MMLSLSTSSSSSSPATPASSSPLLTRSSLIVCILAVLVGLSNGASNLVFRDFLRNGTTEDYVDLYQNKWESGSRGGSSGNGGSGGSSSGGPVFSPIPFQPPPVAPAFQAPLAPVPHFDQSTIDVRGEDLAAASAAAAAAAAEAASLGDNVDLRVSDVLARSILDFALRMSHQLSELQRKTQVFSPLSLMSALALLQLGSRGRTYNELTALLTNNDHELSSTSPSSQYNNPGKLHEQLGLLLSDVQQQSVGAISQKRRLDPWRYSQTGGNMRANRRAASGLPIQHEVHIANGLFAQQGYSLNPDYRQVITSVYKSMLQPLDFDNKPAQSRVTINDWVENQTRGKITNIISGEILPGTRIILASALYFKAFWELSFYDTATRLDNFYPNGELEAPVPVQMMATGGTFPYYEDQQLHCRIIGLPYRGNLSTMYVIQPMTSTVATLQQLQQRLDGEAIERMISQMQRRSAVLAFPKLHLTESINMKRTLKKMGIASIFSESDSDLSLIGTPQSRGRASEESSRYDPSCRCLRPTVSSGGRNPTESLQNLESQRNVQQTSSSANGRNKPDLYVDDIVHKVDFVVNEQGTEAAAATVTYLTKSGPDVLFRANSPFIFIVRHDPTKLIMFYGLVNEPSRVVE